MMMFQLIWGEGCSEVISRKTIETPVKNGGLGLVRLKEKCQAIHLEHNLYRPCSLSFDHPRFLLFTFSLTVVRKMAPDTYSISAPHCFTLSGVYIGVDRFRRKLWDFLEATQRAKSRGFRGNPRGLWLLVEGIHMEIWVVSETRIHVEIQGKFLNRG